MRPSEGNRFLVTCAVIALGIACAQPVAGQPLVPLGDEVAEPLAATGVSLADVEMFGELVYLWRADDGADVVHFVGDFEMQMGDRRLNAREAVIWMTRTAVGDAEATRFEIFLWRDARVRDAGGTVTRGPALFVTLASSGKVRTSADQKSRQPSSDSPVYERALRSRSKARRGAGETQEASPLTVIQFGRQDLEEPLKVRPAIFYQADDLAFRQLGGRNVVTAVGDVYVFRGDPSGNQPLELRADAAVVFLAERSTEPADGEDTAPDDRPGRVAPNEEVEELSGLLGSAMQSTPGDEATGAVEGVYLEGDILLSSGERMIRASRLYYDFEFDRALILDAVVRLYAADRDVPFVLRAAEVRQLSAREFTAEPAMVTSSEFYTPHYYVGASRVDLVDMSRAGPGAVGAAAGVKGTYTLENVTLNAGGVPLLYWPKVQGNLEQSETSIKQLRTGYTENFGLEMETSWDLFSVLALEEPTGFDGTLLLDYFSERGPGVGVNLDYQRDDYFGLYRGYYIHDTGEDSLGAFRDEEPDTENRGRTTWRHRQYLPDDWQLTMELSYVSDKNFMEEYFRPEFENGKPQESLIFLKKQVDNWAFTAHVQYRLNDYRTVTERMPDLSFRLIGEPVGDLGTYYMENRAGVVRYRRSDLGYLGRRIRGLGNDPSSGAVPRVDSRNEIEFPFMVGDFKLAPFVSVRGTAWDESLEGGGLSRIFATYGIRGSHYAQRLYPGVRSDLLDINGVRHVVKTDMVAWGANTNVNSDELYPFDQSIEGIDEVDGVTVGVRQRFQTKRGAPGRERTVDFLTVDVELGVFNDAPDSLFGDPYFDEVVYAYASPTRPENSAARNYVNTRVIYRVSDATNLASETNFDLNDGEVGVFNITYAVERSPRMSYLLGYRFINDTDSNLLGFGVNYKISEKYTAALRQNFDLEYGQTAEFDVSVIRKFPRWFMGLTFSVDDISDNFGVSLTVWPQGVPAATLGNRRFVGLATSTGIRPGL